MWVAVLVEARKLSRSLALALAIVAPALIAVFTFFNMVRGAEARPWDTWLANASAIWAFFMLPMSVTALTALIAHLEHAPKSWDHLRALPLPRWRIYASKAVCAIALTALMTGLVLTMTSGAVVLAGLFKPDVAAIGTPDMTGQAAILTKMLAASLLLIAIQLWTALRFASFVPALSLGIGGTFFAVVATSAREGLFMPWQMPINTLAREAWRADTAFACGALGGVAVTLAMVYYFSVRDAR